MTQLGAQREILHWTVVAGATGLPWVLGGGINWWLGLLTLGLLCWLYDRLFVPPGSMCMGMPFMLPLASGVAYFGYGGILLVHWLSGSTG